MEEYDLKNMRGLNEEEKKDSDLNINDIKYDFTKISEYFKQKGIKPFELKISDVKALMCNIHN